MGSPVTLEWLMINRTDCYVYLTFLERISFLAPLWQRSTDWVACNTDVRSLTLSEAGSLQSRCGQGHAFPEGSRWGFRPLFPALVFASHPWRSLTPFQHLPPSSHDPLFSASLCLNLIILSAETLFWNKVTYWSSGWTWTLENTAQPTTLN